MPDTHIHIHLSGEGSSTVASTGSGASKKVRKAAAKSAPSPTKAKRKVSAYHKTAGAEMKRLKKKHPRMSKKNIMKKAHAHAKRKHKR
jgi:hypothetical protein